MAKRVLLVNPSNPHVARLEKYYEMGTYPKIFCGSHTYIVKHQHSKFFNGDTYFYWFIVNLLFLKKKTFSARAAMDTSFANGSKESEYA